MIADQVTGGTTIAYTDGSCIGNPGPGGWGVHVELPDGRVVEAGGGDIQTTNNRMELRAAIEAVRLTAVAAAVAIVTDSQYVRRGVLEWLKGWQRNGWRTSTGKPVENQDLWKELAGLPRERVEWRWTRGHAGTPGNERCDEIARAFSTGIRRLDEPAGGRATAPTTSPKASPSGVRYLSLVDGIVARHASWPECDRRVRGVRGARFKKARSAAEEEQIVAAWGLGPDALFGV
jgi:ribonuclease HI